MLIMIRHLRRAAFSSYNQMYSCDSFAKRGVESSFKKIPVVQTKFKFVTLLSGGKDSIFNTMEAVALGHECIAVANLAPQKAQESDSYMYQTVGVELVPLMAQAMEVPFYRREIAGTSIN